MANDELQPLNTACVRVLGALMEKEMTTPEQYPLTVNALVSAANQRSSRDPVMDLTEDEVRAALDVLTARDLVAPARDSGRVQRFEHRIRTVLTLRRDETALLCLLLLRGAQTAGELRARADRMFSFDDLAAVQAALDRMAAREQPLAAALARVPGSREVRWVHLLGDAAASAIAQEGMENSPAGRAKLETRVETLEAQVAELLQRLAVLENRPG